MRARKGKAPPKSHKLTTVQDVAMFAGARKPRRAEHDWTSPRLAGAIRLPSPPLRTRYPNKSRCARAVPSQNGFVAEAPATAEPQLLVRPKQRASRGPVADLRMLPFELQRTICGWADLDLPVPAALVQWLGVEASAGSPLAEKFARTMPSVVAKRFVLRDCPHRHSVARNISRPLPSLSAIPRMVAYGPFSRTRITFTAGRRCSCGPPSWRSYGDGTGRDSYAQRRRHARTPPRRIRVQPAARRVCLKHLRRNPARSGANGYSDWC